MKTIKLFLVFVPLFALSCGYFQSPKITIKNMTGDPIFDITVSGNGFHEFIKRIEPGESITITVHPNGESGLKLEFRGKSGAVIKDDLAYLERQDNTHTILTVLPSMDVETKVERLY